MLKIRQLQENEIQTLYKTHMARDFDKEELKPLQRMLCLKEKGLYFCCGLYEDGILQAYACFVKEAQTHVLLLDYYAVCGTQRNRGYGSRFLRLLAEKFTDFSFLLAEVEDPRYFKTREEETTKLRRVAFYEKNGLYKTGLTCTLFGHRYLIMALDLLLKAENEQVLFDVLQQIYHTLFDGKTYEKNVFLKKSTDA